jgi:hypothetical protein
MTIASFAICQVVFSSTTLSLQIEKYLEVAGRTLELLSHLDYGRWPMLLGNFKFISPPHPRPIEASSASLYSNIHNGRVRRAQFVQSMEILSH